MLLFLEEQAQFALFRSFSYKNIATYALVCLLSSYLKLFSQFDLVLSFPPLFEILGRNFPTQEIVQVHDL